MTIRRYMTKDISVLSEWYNGWKVQPLADGRLPEIGYIVPGVAAGFLFRCDANMAFIDGLISNPELPPEKRDEALDVVVATLLEVAAENDCDFVFGISRIPAVLERAKRHKFKILGEFTMVAKEIE